MAHQHQFKESKICPVCQRAFTNRKKWKMQWQQVIYCSKRCRANSKKRDESTSSN